MDAIKTLVIYFSLTEKTKAIARTVAKELNADIEEIVPKKPYPKTDPNKMSWNLVNLSMQAIFHRHCKINKLTCSLKDYDLIVFCTPVWANNIVPPLNTLLKENSLFNKSVVTIVTVDPEQNSEKIFFHLRHKLGAIGATIAQEISIAVVGIPEEDYLEEAKLAALDIKPLFEINKVDSNFNTQADPNYN